MTIYLSRGPARDEAGRTKSTFFVANHEKDSNTGCRVECFVVVYKMIAHDASPSTLTSPSPSCPSGLAYLLIQSSSSHTGRLLYPAALVDVLRGFATLTLRIPCECAVTIISMVPLLCCTWLLTTHPSQFIQVHVVNGIQGVLIL